MKTTIFYYTGTGNSLWTARLLAERIGDNTELLPMQNYRGESIESDAVGFVFPVHIWGVPILVLNFLKDLKQKPNAYNFALAVNAGQVSRTLIQLKEVMEKRGLTLSAGFDIVLPSNYIPWGGPGPVDKQKELFEAVRKKIRTIAGTVRTKSTDPIEHGPLWQRIIFTWVYKSAAPYMHKMDRKFWVDEKCNSCNICAQVCPILNIVMENGKPEWHHRCDQCFACLQWCPQKAIQYGKKTADYDRYHHPDIKVTDLIK
jgi:ferredoxin